MTALPVPQYSRFLRCLGKSIASGLCRLSISRIFHGTENGPSRCKVFPASLNRPFPKQYLSGLNSAVHAIGSPCSKRNGYWLIPPYQIHGGKRRGWRRGCGAAL